SVQHRVARNSGNPYGQVDIEDFTGAMSVMFLGKSYTQYQSQLVSDEIVVINARVQRRDDGITLHAVSLMSPDIGSLGPSGPLVISLPEARATTRVVSSLAEVLERHRGEDEVRLRLVNGSSARLFELPYSVRTSVDLYGELKSLLGPNCVA